MARPGAAELALELESSMSLLNQVLVDLEHRNAEPSNDWLRARLRPVGSAQSLRPLWPLLGLLVVAVCAGAYWHYNKLAPAAAASGVPPPASAAGPADTVARPAKSDALDFQLRLVGQLNSIPKLSLAASDPAPSIEPAVRAVEPPAAAAIVAAPVAAMAAPLQDAAPSINKKMHEASAADRAEADYRAARELVNSGRLREAIDYLRRTLELEPRHSAARQTLVGLLLEQKRQDEAYDALTAALKLDPAQPGFATLLARLQVERGELDAALATLDAARAKAAGHPDYQAFTAAVLARLGRHLEAAGEYSAALERRPQNGLWWLGLGLSLQAAGRDADARSAYQHAANAPGISADLAGFAQERLAQLR